MSRFFAVVSKPARDMAAHFPGPAASPKPTPTAAQPQLIRLDSNENPFGPSPRAIEAMRSALATQNFYPDDDSTELRRRLALHHQVSQEQILVTAGSTEMLALLCQTMLAPGLNAVTSERSFIIYSMAVHATGAQLVQSPMRGEVFALEAIRAAINQNTRIVFLANPNNPTGTMLEATAIDEFLTNIPAHVVVVLDEAYYEFAVLFAALRQLEYSRSLEYLQRGANVIVLRTFSKAHGLAGLRVGYGLGPADLLTYCARMRNPFSVSSVAQAAAIAALDDHDHIARVVSSNASQAQILTHGLSEMGHRVVPTSANFLYCDVREEASRIAACLGDEGVSVRPLRAWGSPNSIRVSIGTPEQNEFFLSAMRKIGGRSQRTQR
ncbi:MAG TPA: histidinol-phosphate transaminase [Candidatus Acidoferrum sp.]|nr:histidinol-phosphate transaminase [Candidatus Acidoferrum sp.]